MLKTVAVVLFEDLKLGVVKSTKTGPSTDSDVLAQLAVLHEFRAVGRALAILAASWRYSGFLLLRR